MTAALSFSWKPPPTALATGSISNGSWPRVAKAAISRCSTHGTSTPNISLGSRRRKPGASLLRLIAWTSENWSASMG
uniref:Uncharacterized protein n=1 Tax=uncultured marine virus TaxID=186617 RepID=A0A0F7L1S9_9VIRU|nr:hypothetical protein [uncultured marine virus]